MIRRWLARRELGSDSGRAAADGGSGGSADGGIELWDECRTVAGGIGRVRRAIPGWRGPARRDGSGKPRKGVTGPGKAANVGEYAIIEGDLDGRLVRLSRGNPDRMDCVLAGVAANLFRAKGEAPEIAESRDAPEDRPDGWPDGVQMVIGKKRSRTAVACISGRPGGPAIAQKVVGLREECRKAGIRKAIVVTDLAVVGDCRDETGTGVKVEIWDWRKLKGELRTHLLGLKGSPDTSF